MIYSVEDVLEGLGFWANDVQDPDGDRAADLFLGMRGLTQEQVTALKMSAQGYTLSQISKEVFRSDEPTRVFRLVLQAKRNLRAAMNQLGSKQTSEHAQ